MPEIADWLKTLGMSEYAQRFAENGIDVSVLCHLTDQDLKDIGVLLGHRRKLLAAIAELPGAAPAAPQPALAEVKSEGAAERRQLTVMFCDLVGSTALSQRLDAEELADLIRAYAERVTAEVALFEGHVAKYMGDGVLAYFGWPQAHEDDAERAIRAGLAIVGAVRDLRPLPDVTPQVRIGIATGPVVVGELIGSGEARERSVVGETPNLAARLQALAEPDAIVIGRRTRALIGDLFEVVDLGSHDVRGFGRPVRAWRVLGEGRAEGRFEALHTASLTPLVGREEELALLLRRWERASDGEGQVVLLSGEPGIGKSRLVHALRERLAGERHTPLSHFCSPYHVNTALHPVIGLLERAAGLRREDPPTLQLDRLEAMLALATEGVREAAPLLAELLGIPEPPGRYPPLELSPQERKERTFRVLLDQFAGLAAREPVLALYEDVHWADPTTSELISRIIDRVQRLPVLAVVTFRPEFVPPWAGHGHVTALSLSRLGRCQGGAMVARVAGGKALPAEVLEQVLARTDGVPLFVEELTKAVLESGLLRDKGDRYVLTGPLPPLAIPATLQDSLMARLDRLASAKEVAQFGAAIGREFSYEMIAAVAPFRHNELHEMLMRLEESGLVLRRGTLPNATFAFKHALVRHAAYDSMLRGKRRQIHAAIARALEERSAAGATALPEIVAHHWTEAGLAEPAVGYWWRAAQLAAQRSATLEEIAHLENGLTLLRTLPDGPENLHLELDMQVALGTASVAAKGWTSPATVAAFGRAAELCERVDDIAQRAVVDFGLYAVSILRGELDAALATSEAMLRRAERDRNPAAKMIAHRLIATVSIHHGEFDTARRHAELAEALYDPKEHDTLAYRFAYEPHIATLSFLAHALLYLGYPDQASMRYGQLMEAIRAHRHSPSVAFGLFQASLFWRDLGACDCEKDLGAGGAIVDELIAVCTEHGFSLWRTEGVIIQGWLLARAGEADRGLAQMREGMAAWANEAKLMMPRWLVLLASALGRLGHPRLALDRIEEGLALVSETGERWNAAELHLRKGELLLASSLADNAEASFREALAVARHQNAKLWELRAAISLARLWREQGKLDAARDLLTPVYGWFTEGFDTPVLKEAKALLETLAP